MSTDLKGLLQKYKYQVVLLPRDKIDGALDEIGKYRTGSLEYGGTLSKLEHLLSRADRTLTVRNLETITAEWLSLVPVLTPNPPTAQRVD